MYRTVKLLLDRAFTRCYAEHDKRYCAQVDYTQFSCGPLREDYVNQWFASVEWPYAFHLISVADQGNREPPPQLLLEFETEQQAVLFKLMWTQPE